MKTILLLRHGKSDWDAGSGEDHQRPLSKRGRRAARLIGTTLRSSDQVPDLALSSSAARARSTVELAVEAGLWRCPVRVLEDLYGAHPGSVVSLIQSQENQVGSLLVAGHEPTCSDLASLLLGGGAVRMPTAGLIRIDFHVESWQAVEPGRGILVYFLIPRLLERR